MMVDDHDRNIELSDSGFFGAEGGDGADALDPAVVELVNELVDRAPAGRDGLIRVLLGLQQAFDRVSWRVQEIVADRFALSPAEIAGVVSFYPRLSAERKGRLKLDICTGTGCWLCGSEGLERALDRWTDGKPEEAAEPRIAVGHERCMGVCGLGPVSRIHDRIRPSMSEAEIEDAMARLDDGDGRFGSSR